MTAMETDVFAPFEIREVPFENMTIRFFEPLILTPEVMRHDEKEPGDVEYLDVICDELSIDVFAKDRVELLSWIHSEIYMNWKYFVSKEDRELNADTLALKRKYLTIAELIDG